MKVTGRKTKSGKTTTYKFKKGYIALVEDIEDLNGFIGPYIEKVEGTSGEEYIFIKDVKITITINCA